MGAMADDANKRSIAGTELFKTESNRIEWIRNIDWVMFSLIDLNQGENVERSPSALDLGDLHSR